MKITWPFNTNSALASQITALSKQVSDLQTTILNAIQTKGEQIMSAVNTSGANLAAAEASLETKITTLGTTLSTAIADLKAEVAAELQAAGVPNATVDAITAKLTALGATADGLTSSAAAADPGAPAPATTA